MEEPSSSSGLGRGKDLAKEEREILANEQQQLQFVLKVGIMKDCELSMPYITQHTNDKSNQFFMHVPEFKDILLQFLEEEKDFIGELSPGRIN